jgi:hypothetical protein
LGSIHFISFFINFGTTSYFLPFSRYGREQGVLVAVQSSGALSVRMLSRASSNLSAFEGSSIQPNEQDVFL